MKKVASAGYALDGPPVKSDQPGGDTDSNKSGNSGGIKISQRLLPKEVMDKIKGEHMATPISGNTLANYRNFKLQSQKEAESNLLNKDISHVLIINTGGTFCMVKTARGYMV